MHFLSNLNFQYLYIMNIFWCWLSAIILVFQSRQEKHEQEQKLNNLHQLYHVMKNESSLVEERLRNKSLEFETCKNTLDNLKREQNRCYRESKIDLKCFKYKVIWLEWI